MYKLIVCDIDGTILRSDGSVSARTISAMRLAEKCGARVSIATGRRVAFAMPIVSQFGIVQPWVAHCGAVVLEPGTGSILMARQIPRQTALDVCSIAEKHGLYVAVFENVYKGQAFYIAQETTEECIQPFWPPTLPECREVATYEQACTSDPVQVGIQGDVAAVGRVLDEISIAYSHEITFFDYGVLKDGTRLADVFAPGVHKWIGVSFLADMWHIGPSEVVAFGDSMNDAQMLEHAGLGVAMGNSPVELKDLANLVAPTNDEDGVATVIQSLAQRGLLGQ